jgi:hypothetical protein
MLVMIECRSMDKYKYVGKIFLSYPGISPTRLSAREKRWKKWQKQNRSVVWEQCRDM